MPGIQPIEEGQPEIRHMHSCNCTCSGCECNVAGCSCTCEGYQSHAHATGQSRQEELGQISSAYSGEAYQGSFKGSWKSNR